MKSHRGSKVLSLMCDTAERCDTIQPVRSRHLTVSLMKGLTAWSLGHPGRLRHLRSIAVSSITTCSERWAINLPRFRQITDSEVIQILARFRPQLELVAGC